MVFGSAVFLGKGLCHEARRGDGWNDLDCLMTRCSSRCLYPYPRLPVAFRIICLGILTSHAGSESFSR
jgi:hypothetical protein